MTNKIDVLRFDFKKSFGSDPILVCAPGRINIIGEHTDYNSGFVLPAAINREVYLAIGLSGSPNCQLIAKDLDERFEFSLSENLKPAEVAWANYFLGVVNEFKDRKLSVQGFNVMFFSEVPIGAGLSSSAAIECAFGFALNDLLDTNLSLTEIALIGQASEHKFAGVKCGIMDQYACCLGQKDKAILLDCQSLDHTYVSADMKGYKFLLIDSKVKHNLVDSEYNLRRNQCEEGVEVLKKLFPQITSLRDITEAQLDQATNIDPVIYKRCKYVLQENKRVNMASSAMENGDLDRLGQLLYQSHQGLSELYQVSCFELDTLVDLAKEEPHVLGSRMMGGGFGGCTLNLVKQEFIEQVTQNLVNKYIEITNISPDYYVVGLSEGIRRI